LQEWSEQSGKSSSFSLGIEILDLEPAEDHVYILFTASPTTNLSNVVNIIKCVTARRLRQEFPKTKGVLEGDPFWFNSFNS